MSSMRSGLTLLAAATALAAPLSWMACKKPPPPTPGAGASTSALAVTTASIATPPASGGPESFRKTAPPPGAPVTFVPPKIEAAKLSNGVRVLFSERRELPIVAVNVVVDRGADQVAPGIGEFAARMMLQGTKTRSAIAISDALERLGASYGVSGGYDSVGVYAQCLAPKLGEMLEVVSDVVQHPAFEKA